MIQDNTIKNIKFTEKEIQVIACFTSNISKSKLIGKILGSSSKTIDTHITNIKRKININDKEEIAFFVRKSKQFTELKNYFNIQYIDHYYRETAQKIEYHLGLLNIVCNLRASPELSKGIVTDTISKSIELTGININTIDNIQSFVENYDSLEVRQFCLFIVQNIEEIIHLQTYTKKIQQNIIYVYLGKELKQISLSKKENILHFDKNNKKKFYKFFISYLVKNYQIIAKLSEELDFLSSIEDIEKNINFNVGDISIDAPAKNTTSKQLTWFTLYEWKISIITLVCIGIISMVWYDNISTKNKTPISVGTSSLKGRNFSDILTYNLPLRNTEFTGRKNTFKKIKNNLNKTNIGVVTLTIVGAGGIGKTQLAKEYAYRAIEGKEYDAVLWINAQTSNSINDSYDELARILKLSVTDLNSEAVKKLVHNELLDKHKVNRILFILDNISKENEIRKYLIELGKQWPIDAKTHVLITSRSQHWTKSFLILDIFTPPEAYSFVMQHLSHEKREDIIKLVELLHYYPLALGQAAKYIKQHTNIADYISLYTSKQQQYLNKLNVSGYKETLWNTMSISLLELSNNAKEILYISSYLETDNIQLEFFSKLSLGKRVAAIKELRDHSFIIMTNHRTSFKMHVLLQEVIRIMIKNNSIWLDRAIMLAGEGAVAFDVNNKLTWNKVRKWLPHITSLYKYMEKRVDTAELLHKYGIIAQHFGLYDLTHELFLDSLYIKEFIYKNSSHIQLIEPLNKLGEVELKLANYDKAKEIYYRVLNIKENYYKSPSHIELSDTLNDMGLIELRLGNYDEAKQFYQRAMKIKEVHYKDVNHIELANTLWSLGVMESRFGYYDKAKLLFQKVLNIKKSYYQNSENKKLFNVLNSIGLSELYSGHYVKAKNIFENILNEKNYQETNDILIVYPLQNLALTEWSLGNFDKAKKMFQRVLKIKQEHYRDPKHILTASTLQGLGLVEFSSGNYTEAKELLELDLSIIKSHYKSSGHIALAISLYTLGLTEEALNNYDVALDYINKSYEILNKFYRDRLHIVMFAEYTPALIWPKLSKKNKVISIDYYRKSLEITKNIFGDKHYFTARYYYLLGQAYEINGQRKKALEQYGQAFIIAEEAITKIGEDVVISKYQKNIVIIKAKLNSLKV